MTFIRRRWRLILLVIVSVLALGLLVAVRTPQGTALVNIIDYRLRLVWWSLTGGPTYDPSRTGSLAGTVRDAAGAPLADAVALVSSVRGEVYQARTDDEGRFRIDGVPTGSYVPLAAAWGYQAVNGPEVRVSAGRELRFADFSLSPYVSTAPAVQLAVPDADGGDAHSVYVHARWRRSERRPGLSAGHRRTTAFRALHRLSQRTAELGCRIGGLDP